MKNKILLIGEAMGIFISLNEEKLEKCHDFISSIAGAEYNVALGLTRLGLNADYVTKLGNDVFGKKILNTLMENRISCNNVIMDKKASTGLMLKGMNTKGDPEICYYRKNSAASTISLEDISKIDITQYDAIHMTGIFPPLSKSCLDVATYLMKSAKQNNVKVFFDPNLRPQLWASNKEMISTINKLATYCDYFLPGYKEGKILCGSDNPKEIAEYYHKIGVKNVIVKKGSLGADAFIDDECISCPCARVTKIIDTVGAGDGFAVGIISGVCDGLTMQDTLIRANAIGAMQIMSKSDNEDLPDKKQLAAFIKNNMK